MDNIERWMFLNNRLTQSSKQNGTVLRVETVDDETAEDLSYVIRTLVHITSKYMSNYKSSLPFIPCYAHTLDSSNNTIVTVAVSVCVSLPPRYLGVFCSI